MSTENEDLALPDELTQLKAKADLMGIKYHPSIGIEALRAKIREKLTDGAAEDASVAAAAPASDVQVYGGETENQRKLRLQQEAGELVRIRITSLNPLKKEWPGEIISVANDVVGTFKRFIPFGVEEGWHVPRIILTHLQDKMFQTFYNVPGPRGEKIRKGKLVKEYAIEILPSLTPAELQELAQRQAMAGGVN